MNESLQLKDNNATTEVKEVSKSKQQQTRRKFGSKDLQQIKTVC
jgi:hypothetical protein